MLYFSYGSNMSLTRLQDRVPSSDPVEVLNLLLLLFRVGPDYLSDFIRFALKPVASSIQPSVPDISRQ